MNIHTLLSPFVLAPKTLAFQITNVFQNMRFIDYVDIFVLALLIGLFWFTFRKSKVAHQFSILLLIWGAFTFLLESIGLTVVSYILRYILRAGVIGAIFITEMKLVEMIGKTGDFSLIQWAKSFFLKKNAAEPVNTPIDSICQAATDLARSKTGGLIVIERKNRLDDLIHTGVDIDAAVSPYLIRNIFYEGAPLHDGALIIRNGRISAAGCILPITHRVDVDPDLGTRHRAAIGMSENSDAVIIVISEESGAISIACNTVLTRGYDYISLKAELSKLLESGTQQN